MKNFWKILLQYILFDDVYPVSILMTSPRLSSYQFHIQYIKQRLCSARLFLTLKKFSVNFLYSKIIVFKSILCILNGRDYCNQNKCHNFFFASEFPLKMGVWNDSLAYFRIACSAQNANWNMFLTDEEITINLLQK